ncbi:aminoglycoside phosphotransferase family protein [Streptomyces sp. 4N509B]|uniref:aminoglycoside phosphotransferase family protein n=1 Tax=Streptomyces sp. 4N509B TaxID=3457413 RepID=UPI003FD5ACC1
MTARTNRTTRMHADEPSTDAALVGRLLAGQFPHWADLPIRQVVSAGTDHTVYRLGDELVVRLPRISWATGQADKEATWLPRLAPHVPLRLPVQLERGLPAEGYPYAWSVYAWLPGRDANAAVGDLDLDRAAVDLAAFVRALRDLDTAGAPPRRPGGRGGPLAEHDQGVREAVARLGDRVDGAATLRAWEASLDVPAFDGEDVWIHSDLLPGNLLCVDDRLTAVIDFGGLTVGDPACDLMAAWNLFTGTSRARFRAELAVDDAAWLRGRGWALAQAVIALPYYWETNPGIVRQATNAVRQVLADDAPRAPRP